MFASASIASIPKTASSHTQTPSDGLISTAQKSSTLSTPSSSVTLNSKPRATQKPKHASKSGGASSDQQSNTPLTSLKRKSRRKPNSKLAQLTSKKSASPKKK